ncbi:MAG: THUMP domain-containing class I SAM-dependent RNA methyltransferase [Alkalispirochaeta sp.]
MGRVILKKRTAPVQILSPEIVATCPGGAEAVLAAEMNAVGFEDVRIETGAVRAVRSASAGIATANQSLRTAARVLVPVARFAASDYDGIYRGVSEIPWERLLPTDRTFAITATTRSRGLTDHRFLAMRTKDAIVDRQRTHTNGVRSSVNRDEPDLPVVIFANDREVEVSLDSSGAPLHERGYRTERGEAPLRETVAAMMLLSAGWPQQSVVVDPFCGSGTIAIEAALIARGIVPGRLGRRYAYQRWTWLGDFDASGTGAPAERPTEHRAGTQRIVAADSDPAMIEIARRNAQRAGVAEYIEFFTADATETVRHVAGAPGVVVTNPPYGRRLQPEDTARLYRGLGAAMRRDLSGWDVWMLLGEPAPIKTLGLTPDRKVSVFNGGLPVQLCRYRMHARKQSAS